ncbi:Uu.00g142910.m01.CDS01 [Anthostomella pinea]|uniref:Uu.00g142910.m01.CDS01 n=1 Tax=Anthostomella pinea TaxID=933095 RepID=A0AAI8VK32_9PEZI|nr:Uu.00g142910.m01.CDS01 [Anthostomella pinea]
MLPIPALLVIALAAITHAWKIEAYSNTGCDDGGHLGEKSGGHGSTEDVICEGGENSGIEAGLAVGECYDHTRYESLLGYWHVTCQAAGGVLGGILDD